MNEKAFGLGGGDDEDPKKNLGESGGPGDDEKPNGGDSKKDVEAPETPEEDDDEIPPDGIMGLPQTILEELGITDAQMRAFPSVHNIQIDALVVLADSVRRRFGRGTFPATLAMLGEREEIQRFAVVMGEVVRFMAASRLTVENDFLVDIWVPATLETLRRLATGDLEAVNRRAALVLTRELTEPFSERMRDMLLYGSDAENEGGNNKGGPKTKNRGGRRGGLS